jgi:hypothetical protein
MRRFGCLFGVLALLLGIAPSAFAQNQGLTAEQLQDWYHLSQGTEVFPYRFLRAIKDFDTGKPFIDNLDRFGFILDPKSEYGVPVGMTVSDTRDLRFAGVKMIGLNCSACHTAEMTFQGKRVRFDGGTNMLNVNAFSDGLKKSIQKTIANPVELLGFLSRLAQQELDALGDEGLAGRLGKTMMQSPLSKKSAELVGRLAAKAEKPAERIFASAAMETIGKELARKPINLRKGMVTRNSGDSAIAAAKAKLKDDLATPLASLKLLNLPLLPGQVEFTESLHNLVATVRLLRARLEILTQSDGDQSGKVTAGFGRVDAFGAARNRLFPDDPIILNAPVRFPFIWEIPVLPWYHWDANTTSALERNVGEAIGVGVVVDMDTKESTLQLDNLLKLEGYATNLKVPTWPEDVFGKIDQDLAKKGKELFGTHCAKCHSIPEPGAKVKDEIVPFSEMGVDKLATDRMRVDNIRTLVNGNNFFDSISPILKGVIKAAEGTPEGGKNLWRPSTANQPQLVAGHPNRALRSVWASPPYLHNGSVPSIFELMLPPAQRTKAFAVGHREYDPSKLGYELRVVADAGSTLLDATLFGNRNSGHDYGAAAMNNNDRFAIIEYLKTR